MEETKRNEKKEKPQKIPSRYLILIQGDKMGSMMGFVFLQRFFFVSGDIVYYLLTFFVFTMMCISCCGDSYSSAIMIYDRDLI